MKPIVKICICAVVAAALIAALCVLLIPAARWSLPDVLHFGDSYSDESSYQIGADTVNAAVDSLELHWSSGEIHITTHKGSGVILTESGYANERQQLRWRVKDGKLIVRECASGLNWSLPRKTLEVSLPEGGYHEISLDVASAVMTLSGRLNLDQLDVDSASGSLTAEGLTVTEVSFDSASGNCTLTDCTVAEFEMDTASGRATLSGSFDAVELDSASGDLELHTAVAPRKISIETVSGSSYLYLPADAEFRASLEALSGDLNVEDFDGSYRGGEFYCGGAANEYKFESVSGDVTICKEKR